MSKCSWPVRPVPLLPTISSYSWLIQKAHHYKTLQKRIWEREEQLPNVSGSSFWKIIFTSVSHQWLTLHYSTPSCTGVNERRQAVARGSGSKRQGTAETNTLCNEALKPKPWPLQRASNHLLTSWRQLGLMSLQQENCCTFLVLLYNALLLFKVPAMVSVAWSGIWKGFCLQQAALKANFEVSRAQKEFNRYCRTI